MFAADTLSRYPVGKPDADDIKLAEEAELACIKISAAIVLSLDVFATTEEHIRETLGSDEQYKLLSHTVETGTFAKSKANEKELLKEFYDVRNRLSIVNGLVTYTFETGAPRLVVPKKLRKDILKNLHSAHQGVESILARARTSVYWPGINKEIKLSCASCKLCNENAPSLSKEPLIMTGPPEYPFEKVVADLFTENDAWYLGFACRLTGWLEIGFFPRSTKSSEIIHILRELFQRFGVPEEISLDGGSNLKSQETRSFLKSWGVTHVRLASAYYLQSNGRAEAAVRTAKRITKGNTGHRGNLNTDAVSKALMQYRNTPIKGAGASPAQLMLGRNIRDSVPQPKSAYKVSSEWEKMLRQREKSLCRSAASHMEETVQRSTHSDIAVGTEVLIQNVDSEEWDRSGLVVEALPFRQYKVRVIGSGRITLRNRIHLRPVQVFKSVVLKVQSPLQDVVSAQLSGDATGSSQSVSTLSESTHPESQSTESYQTPSSSSYHPSSSDISSQMTARSRSPMVVQREVRRRQEPDRYGSWGK